MKVSGKHYRTIWMDSETGEVSMIDQNALPFAFEVFKAKNYQDTCHAIRTMITRGAGAIGAAAGFAMVQAFLEGAKGEGRRAKADDYTSEQLYFFNQARKEIEATRPTARNLFYATERVFSAGLISVENAVREAQLLADQNITDAKLIGEHGSKIVQNGSRILTHCNAGWLGFVDYGSALAPLYIAKEQGKEFFVYADETRPRNQGARLTAWELQNGGIPHKIVPDNAGAYLVSKGMVDFVIVGADRIAANGDTANKIGTFEKAIVAKEFGIPFYVAVPFSTIDFSLMDGSQIPIEERSEDEVLYYSGPDSEGVMRTIRMASPGSNALNPAFDVTPAKFITGFITEKGIIKPDELDKFSADKPLKH
ncbi:MAG: S-methyl-5-thioribose-1-phosphate isomerase [Bacteroidales bacterium]|nr:S-methyl-5-thioribose-1-phosphate isomerase [Bacteroidales bacterium]